MKHLSKKQQINIIEKSKESFQNHYQQICNNYGPVDDILGGNYGPPMEGLCYFIEKNLPDGYKLKNISLFKLKNAIKYGGADKKLNRRSPYSYYWWETRGPNRNLACQKRIKFLDWMLCKLAKPSLKDKIINFFKGE